MSSCAIALGSPKNYLGKSMHCRQMDKTLTGDECPHCGSDLERSGQPTGGMRNREKEQER